MNPLGYKLTFGADVVKATGRHRSRVACGDRGVGRRRCVVPTALVITLCAGCSRDLSRDQASELISDHLLAVAPTTYADTAPIVRVEEIIRPNENERTVRFRVASRAVDDTLEAEHGTLFVTTFHRSDDSWALVRYGEALAEGVASLLVEEWRSAYDDLLEVYEQLDAVYDVWRSALTERSSAALRRDRVRTYLQLEDAKDVGPDSATVARLADSLGTTVRPGYVWGMAPSTLPELWAPVLWVGKADTDDVRCARALGYDDRMPETEFLWVERHDVTCRGRGPTYAGYTNTIERARERIAAGGGVYLP